jgi:hypothetical protein
MRSSLIGLSLRSAPDRVTPQLHLAIDGPVKAIHTPLTDEPRYGATEP